MEGPGLDMMETERHARLEKRERLLDTFVCCLVIGVYSAMNNIAGFYSHLEIESFGLPWSLWMTLRCTYTGALIPCMLLESS